MCQHDDLVEENMSLLIIVNQFNKINKILRMENPQKGMTPSQIAEQSQEISQLTTKKIVSRSVKSKASLHLNRVSMMSL